MTKSRDQLISRIAEEEARLSSLDRERDEALARLATLRQEFAALPAVPCEALAGLSLTARDVPSTAADKVRLFRSLFRGRSEVYPTRFLSKKTGNFGYAPACSNKFVPGVCGLPLVKCGECPNQAFLPFDDRAVLDHLQGRHVMGVYPLLVDETCWFLAADFDGAAWQDDLGAFVQTCASAGIPVSVERSRSGNGAHAWFFFAEPIPASTARKMGCFLITETMARHHQLGMSSYDRLFPNQDTMPRGGFGNLIAMPLQHEVRKAGNTLFLNDAFEPHADQWAYLASISPLTRAAVDAIADDATRRGAVIGVPGADLDDDDYTRPWDRSPTPRRRRPLIPGPLPPSVRGVLAQRLFVEKAGLPSALLNAIKRLAAFQNPEFYKRQTMRLSTAMTPRVISCAEELPHHTALPRGCLSDAQDLLREYGVTLEVDDQRQVGEPVSFEFKGHLTPLQLEASRAMLQHDIGVLVAPPGIGKTVLGTYLVAARGRNTLVLVHRRPLLDQWVAQLSMFLDIDEKQIGQIAGGKRRASGRLDVGMIQSLVRKESVDEVVATYGQVIVDECHHVPAVSFERVLSAIKARYVAGLTATPHRRDGHHPILEMQLGPARFTVDPRSNAARRPFAHRLLVRETSFRPTATTTDSGIQGVYRALAMDESRNRLILDDVIRAVHERRFVILLTERRDHLEYLAKHLQRFVRHLVVLRGGMTPKERAAAAAALAAIPDDEERLVLATGRYIGEGFDDARLDTLFLAMPVSWKGTLAQYTGRLHRLHPAKDEVRIFDYVDRDVPMLAAMFEKRLRAYRAIGYTPNEPLPGYEGIAQERMVEYEEGTSHDIGDIT